MHTISSTRAATLLVIVGLLLTSLIGRVAYLQTFGREQIIRKADRQQHQSEVLYARRGSIFDSSGLLMAGTVQTQCLYIDPKFMQDEFQTAGRSLVDMDKAIKQLADLLDKNSFELSKMLSDRYASRYIKVADHLEERTVAEIEKLKLPGVGFTPMPVREYPMGSLGAHILGGVGGDSVGLEGLEMKFEKVLAGKNGFKTTLKDARRRPIGVAADDYLPPQNGQHVMLTIDANIQMIAEQELAGACDEFKAKRGEVVVMDPKTGDVLALANWPTFNPQNLEDSTDEVRRNRALTDPYEPGSTIKPFIAGPAIEWNITKPTEVFHTGKIYHTPYGRKIEDVHGYDSLAMWDVLVKSSNIGMSLLGERMGNAKLFEALTTFRFGERTGIDLPGEDPGLINPLNKWNKFSTESVSQGYELMVTPLQLARGICSYANGGRLVKPRIIKGLLSDDGGVVSRTEKQDLKLMPQAIDPITAAQIKRILCDVVIRGTAQKARSKTWNIFGKTGTAHISHGKAGYDEQAYTSSFVGGAPAENPQVVIAMIIHEPDKTKAHFGGTVSAPAACHALERMLSYEQVPASPDLPIPPPQIANVLYEFNAKLYTDRMATAGE